MVRTRRETQAEMELMVISVTPHGGEVLFYQRMRTLVLFMAFSGEKLNDKVSSPVIRRPNCDRRCGINSSLQTMGHHAQTPIVQDLI